jgi:hypothetical protein
MQIYQWWNNNKFLIAFNKIHNESGKWKRKDWKRDFPFFYLWWKIMIIAPSLPSLYLLGFNERCTYRKYEKNKKKQVRVRVENTGLNCFKTIMGYVIYYFSVFLVNFSSFLSCYLMFILQ